MNAGTIRVLIRLISSVFYKEQMGFLLMVFGVIFSHIFWIKPLGGHLNHEDSVKFHLILLYSFASELIMLILFLTLLIVYAWRVVGFMKRQLKLESNQFLFYSINALPSSEQIRNWLGVFFVIFIPAILLTVGIVYAGFKYGEVSYLIYYPVSIILLCYGISVFVVRNLNRCSSAPRNSFLSITFQKIQKPLWSIPLFNFLFHQKIVFLLFKLLSIVIAIGGVFLFQDLIGDVRVFQLIILTMVMINSYLVYAMKKYEDEFLIFSRNFPETIFQIWGRIGAKLVVLFLPELFVILVISPINDFIPLCAFLLGIGCLFEALLLRMGEIQMFYQVIFGMFLGAILLILGGFGWYLLFAIPISLILIRRFYYRNITLE